MIIDIPSFQNMGHKGRIQVFFLNLTNIILLNDHQLHHVFESMQLFITEIILFSITELQMTTN